VSPPPSASAWPLDALLLTAGVGSRLHPLTLVRAKPAVPLAGVPLITRILRACADAGVSRVVLNLHHRPETIARVAGDGRDLGLTLRYSWEQPVLGSAGGPRHALPLLDGDPYLLLNGDTLATVDLRALWDHHQGHGALVTMALIPNPEPERFGGVLVDADGWITGFCRRGDPRPNYHFFSAQVVARSVFAGLPDGVPAESVLRVFDIAQQSVGAAYFLDPKVLLSFRMLGLYVLMLLVRRLLVTGCPRSASYGSRTAL